MNNSLKKLWIGHTPAVDFCSVTTDFINTIDTRISSEFYNKFKVINFTDIAVSEFEKWPFVIDEIFKMSSGETTFVIKFNMMSKTFGLPKFYKQIYDLADGNVTFVAIVEDKIPGVFILTFRATRRKHDTSSGWTFGIIWDGKSESNLLRFVESVKIAAGNSKKYELLICGPKPHATIDINFTLVATDETTEQYANISRKKNLIAKQSSYENLCIVHNRYEIDPSFIDAFENINHDYDVCVIKQTLLETGIRVPDWVSQPTDQKLIANYLLKYGDYSPYIYIPGGMFVIKRSILLENPFNELATWNMAEDVELSQRLSSKSILPRLNSKAMASVISIRKEILSDFKEPNLNYFYENLDQFTSNSKFVEMEINKKLLSVIKIVIFNPALLMNKLKNKLRR